MASSLPDVPTVAPAPGLGDSLEERIAELKATPFFMTELEDIDPENNDIAALQALSYEGSPLENGTDFKERGNEVFKQKRWIDAREFYKRGIDILWLEERRRAREKSGAPANGAPNPAPMGKSSDTPDEIEKERAVLAQLYTNRAACHLWLENFRSCWLDCGAALRLDPSNVKALYRASRAFLALDRTEEAVDTCKLGLALDPENEALKETIQEANRRGESIKKRAKDQWEREARKKAEGKALA